MLRKKASLADNRLETYNNYNNYYYYKKLKAKFSFKFIISEILIKIFLIIIINYFSYYNTKKECKIIQILILNHYPINFCKINLKLKKNILIINWKRNFNKVFIKM